jgi:DNA polymerase III delta subunit
LPRAPDSESTTNGAPLAYLWGDDVLALRRAVERLARDLGTAGEPLHVWRAEGSAATDFDELALRLGTAPLFGGGLLAVVAEPLALLRSKADRERAVALLERVATGNALVFTELLGTGGREPAAASAALREAIARAGGRVQRLQAPRSGQLAAWIAERAAELGIRIEPPAVKLLAERLGGGVREDDADRRYQTELAEAQLELLALYRPAGPVSTWKHSWRRPCRHRRGPSSTPSPHDTCEKPRPWRSGWPRRARRCRSP